MCIKYQYTYLASLPEVNNYFVGLIVFGHLYINALYHTFIQPFQIYI